MRKGRYIRRRTASRMLTTVLALLLVVGLSVGGTLAWLTATTENVTNTFTVGDINIKLDEATLSEDGKSVDENNRTQANTYKVVPGGTSPKTPKLTVEKKSEDCYIYVLVTNEVKLGTNVVATPNIDTNTWIPVGTTAAGAILYRYKDVVAYDKDDDQGFTVFTQVSYSETITKDNIDDLNGKTIKLEGYAHQAANIELTDVDTAAKAHFSAT